MELFSASCIISHSYPMRLSSGTEHRQDHHARALSYLNGKKVLNLHPTLHKQTQGSSQIALVLTTCHTRIKVIAGLEQPEARKIIILSHAQATDCWYIHIHKSHVRLPSCPWCSACYCPLGIVCCSKMMYASRLTVTRNALCNLRPCLCNLRITARSGLTSLMRAAHASQLACNLQSAALLPCQAQMRPQCQS